MMLASSLRAQGPSLHAQPFVTGLSFPVAMVPDPTSSARLFVVEQQGHIRVVVNGVLQATDFLNLSAVVLSGAERGLLGMAIDPAYAANRRFYVYFTRQDDPATPGVNETGGLVVARFTRSVSDPLTADPASRFDFRWGSTSGPTFIDHSTNANHNGGTIMFGPDGYLYIGIGDGGAAYDPPDNAQNPNKFLGKMLRIDVNVSGGNAQGYQIPADNPFVDNTPIPALPEIWDLGLRNPWKYSFDDPARGGTGALIIADVGQDAWEEINYEPVGQGGRNYGWRIREGSNPEPHVPPTTPAFLPLANPVFEYFHSSGTVVGGNSVTGGYVYRGSDLSAFWRGRYFFADFSFSRVWSTNIAPGTGAFSNIIEHTAAFGIGPVSSFGVDTHGELYIVGYGSTNQGLIYRLCEITVTPGVTSFAALGGTGTATVSTQPGCTWSVAAGAGWISVLSNPQGVGSGTIVFRVAPNTATGATTRGAVLTIGGQPVPVGQSSVAAVHGDIDGNGSADLLWQHSTGLLAAWLMNGTTLVDGRPLGMGSLMDPSWRIVASGDFDRDGSRDVVFQHQGDGRLAIWLMSGTTQLAGIALSPDQVPDTNWKIRGAADFDRDGWTDLIWQHQTTGQIAVWLMTGTQLRDGRLLTPGSVSDLNWRIVGVGDMNGDSSPDLVWQHQTNGLISVWLMNGSSLLNGVLLSPGQVSDTNWKIRAVTDLNGDGKLDLVWQNQSTGVLSAWLMNGLSRMGEGLLLSPNAVPDTGWQIVGPK